MNVASTSFTKQFGVLMAIYGPPFPNSGGPLQRGRLNVVPKSANFETLHNGPI